MGYSHYPKLTNNLVLAWVQPPPPEVDPDDADDDDDGPDFLGRPFSEINRFEKPLEPGASFVGFHDAQPYTRFYGTLASDQPLEITLSFSNDEVDAKGVVVNDANVSTLNYDAEGVRQAYVPGNEKTPVTGPKFFSMIFGRFLKVEIKNTGKEPTTMLRAYVRGSVF
jgi:hypothetical protein